MKNCFQKGAVAFAGLFFFDLVNAPRGPADDWWINVTEVPFVGGHLAVRMLIPFAQNDIELAFGELRVDQGEGNAVEGEVPGSIPRILPFIRHRHDALVVEMAPLGIAAGLSLCRRRGLARIAI